MFIPLLLLLNIHTLLGQGDKVKWEDQTFTSASGVEVTAQVGYLTVLEDRQKEGSAELELKFVRLRAQTEQPGSPLVYLEGGPGASCTWQVEQVWALDRWVSLLQLGDVILFDQRGTGEQSERMTWINMEPLPADLLLTTEAVDRHFQDMATRALPEFAAQGIEASAYTSVESANDLEELRQALDIERWHLMGFSYGTHLGLHYLREFSAHVDRAVLVGAEGWDDTFKRPLVMDQFFTRLSWAVVRDAELSKDIPDLLALYDEVSTQLTNNPVTLQLTSPLTGEEMPIQVGKSGLDFIMMCDLGDASDLPVFPRLLYSIKQGDYSVLRWFVQKRLSVFYGIHLMAINMDLYSGLSPARRAQIMAEAKESRFGTTVFTPYLALQEVWPTPPNSSQADLHHCEVPTLFLSGEWDFNTPPIQAALLAQDFPNSTHLTVAGAGHEQIVTNPTVQRAIADFLLAKPVDHLKPANDPLRFIPLHTTEGALWHPSLGEQ